MTLTFGSLFAGIGGIELGLERAGLQCKWQVEIDPFCQKVLAKHWPDVERHDDVKTFQPKKRHRVDLIAFGFPCQDISSAGKRVGLDGARSGLCFEALRVVGAIRPRYVFVENVSALLNRGLDRVLGEMAALGYDAEWHCVQAADFGAPHLRDRIFLFAYADDPGRGRRTQRRQGGDGQPALDGPHRNVAHPCRERCDGQESSVCAGWDPPGGSGQHAAHPGQSGLPLPQQEDLCRPRGRQEGRAAAERGWWAIEPNVGRVAVGVPSRVDRLRSLGNAVVPQIVEWFGQRIIEFDQR